MGRQGTAKFRRSGERRSTEIPDRKEQAANVVASKLNRPQLVVDVRPDWHEEIANKGNSASTLNVVVAERVKPLKAYAQQLYDEEIATYSNLREKSSSSQKFMSAIMISGTWEDKISAMTLLVQESPLHNPKALEMLVAIAGKRSRTQALMALSALKDLLGQGVVLPPNRKLNYFEKQADVQDVTSGLLDSWNMGDPLPFPMSRRLLITYLFEDWLKHKYFEIVQIIEQWSNDELEHARMRAVTFAWELLKDKPEQEENLLRLLVNKLGDQSKKVASRTSYLLLQLQTLHPSMKQIIIEAIETNILFRSSQSSHAKYYAVITLNQTVLHIAEPHVANKLLDVYFSLFVLILKQSQGPTAYRLPTVGQLKRSHVAKTNYSGSKKASDPALASKNEEFDEKLIAQILTGINRAVPFGSGESIVYESHLDTMFRIAHSSNFNTSIQALLLIQQIATKHRLSSERFYRVLYDSLLDSRLPASSKQTMYLNLLYRSLKADLNIKRVKAFVKRLLQTLVMHEPSFVCAALYLIGKLQHNFPSIRALLEQPELLEDEDESPEAKVAEQDTATDTAGLRLDAQRVVTTRTYDGRKRDPEHSNADKSCLWEALPWLTHFHPSVALYATRLLASASMPEITGPQVHSTTHFLDRFAYRNPKLRGDGAKGQSIMQPALAANTADSLFSARSKNAPEEAINTETFWSQGINSVPIEEVFFHTYFNQHRKGKSTKTKSHSNEVDSDREDEEEDDIWNALVGSRPELEASDIGDESSSEEISLSDSSDYQTQFSEEFSENGGNSSYDETELFEDDQDGEFGEAGSGLAENQQTAEAREQDSGKRKRRKIGHLPTFAAFEDYAEIMSQGDSDADLH